MSQTQDTDASASALIQGMDWSSIVYAYGHQFAKEAKLLGIEVPLHDIKINRENLAQMMFAANFVALAQAGAVSLSLDERKMLFIKSQVVLVKKLQAVQTGTLTNAMMQQITGDPKKDDAKGIVYRVLGKDYKDPYGVVANWARRDLLKHGYYDEEERGKLAQMVAGSKLIARRDQLSTLAGQAEMVRNALKNFEAQQSTIYNQLLQDVKGGLSARVEHDNDD